jgi:hypothetical protein
MTSIKVLLTAAGVAALLTSPTLAASRAHRHVPVQAPAYSNTVVAPNGQTLGADPDAQIRSEMLRDWPGAGAATGN